MEKHTFLFPEQILFTIPAVSGKIWKPWWLWKMGSNAQKDSTMEAVINIVCFTNEK